MRFELYNLNSKIKIEFTKMNPPKSMFDVLSKSLLKFISIAKNNPIKAI